VAALTDPATGQPVPFVPLAKRRVADIGSLGVQTDNIEGMTLGPALPDGRRSLILVSDDNFSAAQVTQFVALALSVEEAPAGTLFLPAALRDAALAGPASLTPSSPAPPSATATARSPEPTPTTTPATATPPRPTPTMVGTTPTVTPTASPTPTATVVPPAAGEWGRRAELPEANSEMAVAELDGKIYVIGGYPASRETVGTVQVYDAATDRWSLTTPLPAPLNHEMAVAVGGLVYVIGGQSTSAGSGSYVDTVYAYDPADATWRQRARMPTARSAGVAAVIGGKIYVAGGRPPRGADFAVYDPVADRWETLPDLPTQRNHLAGAAIGGKLYVVGGRFEGGFNSPVTDVVEVFDPATRAWSTVAPMPTRRGGINGIAAYGCLHVFGGEGNTADPSGLFDQHEVYDPRSNTWTRLPPMPTAVHGVTGLAFIDGWIHLPGGGIRQGGSSGSTLHQVYRPAMRCQ
jgi:N-acetylneuraminic acid mutarotase